jgi:hypothetical protein
LNEEEPLVNTENNNNKTTTSDKTNAAKQSKFKEEKM